MCRENQERFVKKTMVAATLAGVALTLAPTAQADQFSFVNALDNQGVYYNSVTDVIDTGKRSCHALRGGADISDLLDVVQQTEGMTPREAALTVVAASNEMCPDTAPMLDAFVSASR